MERTYPVPFNEAEAVFERLFDPRRCHLDQWRITVEPQGAARVWQNFLAVQCDWDSGPQPVRIRLRREMDLDASGYDHLTLCATAPSTAALTVRAVVDGTERVLIDRAPGRNTGRELDAPLGGARISAVEIEMEDPARTPGMAWLTWLGVFHHARREEMRTRPSPYRDGWGDLMLPPDQTVPAAPVLGLFFGPEDLEALRRKASSAVWKPVVDQLRAVARSHLKDEPWRGVGPTWNNCRVRDGRTENDTMWIDWDAMRICSFVGLLDDDAALMRMALNHALAAAHCGCWHPTFQYDMPGSAWETRAFYHYRVATNLVFAWDWAGAYLTGAGRELLAHAVSVKGLPWILQSLMRHAYVRQNNQGIFFAYGAVICETALAKVWPYGGELLDASVHALDQTVNAYYAEDGGTYEGVGYATGALGQALAAYQLVARRRGVPLKEVVPPVVPKVADYICAMLSTERPYGAVIKVADGGRAGSCVYAGSLGLLCCLTEDEGIPELLAGLNTLPVQLDYSIGPILNVICGPDELPEAAVSVPIFRVLDKTGMLCCCRPAPRGLVRLQLVGGPAGAGHCHEDRGSFVLEAFGEEIAVDRGQMAYDDPRCNVIKFARYHNLLIPDGPDGRPLRQVNPCPAATIPEGASTVQMLRCKIDVTAAWPDPVALCVREIESNVATDFFLTDRVELREPRSVAFHVHSRYPWHKSREGWVTRGKRTMLLVIPQWATVAESGEEDFVDGTKAPAYHLTLRAAPADRHALRTLLVVSLAPPPSL
jgi:hypothetical protein